MASPSLAAHAAPDTRRPRLIIPGLAGFYDWVDPYIYPLTRFVVGATLLPIGIGKIESGMAPVIGAMAHFNLEPVGAAAFCVVVIESVGALCIMLGFLTRFWAAAMAIEMAVITVVALWPQGYARAEQSLIWGALALIVALKGSGRFSIDRLIGWEL